MTSDNNVQKKCVFCGEGIPAGAGRCPYCGSILEVTFENNYRINEQENVAVNNVDDTKPVDGDQTQVEQNAEVSFNTSEPQNGDEQQEDPGLKEIPMTQAGKVQLPEPKSRIQSGERPYNNGGYVPDRRYGNDIGGPLSNGLKVLLTVIFTIIPGVGQLAGIITAIVFMNSEGDSDRKSFGVALLVACLVMFVLACIGCFILVIAISSSTNQFNY